MSLFGLSKKERERRMSMISSIKPTSKASLKMQCIIICHGDVNEAEKMYDFFAKDMNELPDYDPVPPTMMSNVKENAFGIYQFLKENKDDIAQGIEYIRSMISKRSAATEVVDVIPPINQAD